MRCTFTMSSHPLDSRNTPRKPILLAPICISQRAFIAVLRPFSIVRQALVIASLHSGQVRPAFTQPQALLVTTIRRCSEVGHIS